MSELFPLGLTALVLKNPGNGEAVASNALPSTGECSCGARRASDLEPGTGANGSVRPVVFGRDDISRSGASRVQAGSAASRVVSQSQNFGARPFVTDPAGRRFLGDGSDPSRLPRANAVLTICRLSAFATAIVFACTSIANPSSFAVPQHGSGAFRNVENLSGTA
jgi:hypothetical protein